MLRIAEIESWIRGRRENMFVTREEAGCGGISVTFRDLCQRKRRFSGCLDIFIFSIMKQRNQCNGDSKEI